MKITKSIRLALSILVCLVAGMIGSVFTISSITTWYNFLIKPSFSPPNWAFGPVWTTLYILMGISLYLVWSSKATKERSTAIRVFWVQLALNVIWSLLFFGLRSPLAGLIEIVALWISIIVNIVVFYRIEKKAAYLFIPYIIWVSIAAVLNLFVFLLNV